MKPKPKPTPPPQATERDPDLQKADPHRRLLALLEALMMTNPDALKRTLGGLYLARVCADGTIEKVSELIKGGAGIDVKVGVGRREGGVRGGAWVRRVRGEGVGDAWGARRA